MDTIILILGASVSLNIILLIFSAMLAVKLRELLAFVAHAGIVIPDDIGRVDSDELLKQILSQLNIIGHTPMGKKMAEMASGMLVSKLKTMDGRAPVVVLHGLEEWNDMPWDDEVVEAVTDTQGI